MILLIMIHNIDSPPLMNREAQQMIAEIGNVRGVNILGSFDNYLYPSKLDYRLIYKMKAVVHIVDTYQVYLKEIEMGSLHREQMKCNQDRGFRWVIDSFNKNQKLIVKLMIENQLNDVDGMSLQDLL